MVGSYQSNFQVGGCIYANIPGNMTTDKLEVRSHRTRSSMRLFSRTGTSCTERLQHWFPQYFGIFILPRKTLAVALSPKFL